MGKRTYADANTECWSSDANADWGAVDGCLLVFDDDLLRVAWGRRSARGRGVEGRGWGVAVYVGVVGDVCVIGSAGH
jgi:hypothetical protein